MAVADTNGPDQGRDIVIDVDLSKRTSELADENLALLDEHGVQAIDVLGSVGSGKTTLIQQMVRRLKDRYCVAVIAGDITTRIDADRIEVEGVEVLQIQTGGACHLDGEIVRRALERLDLDELDLVIIENVGNLICPAAFPVGTQKRLLLLSVTEGPYMAIKHPIMVRQADVAVINKVDLAEAMEVDVEQLAEDIRSVHPRIDVVSAVARAGEGIDGVIDVLGLSDERTDRSVRATDGDDCTDRSSRATGGDVDA
ncbi:MAG: hydrogenase nickel incorporation protein HypB [Armatimonadia bacterium]|nr:hydrogenase nickel incorporation protein HypB [Armatimonadia bacterium]